MMFTRLKEPSQESTALPEELDMDIAFEGSLPRTSSNCSITDQVFDDGFLSDSCSEISFQITLNDSFGDEFGDRESQDISSQQEEDNGDIEDASYHRALQTLEDRLPSDVFQKPLAHDEVIFSAIAYIKFLHEQLETPLNFLKPRKDGHPKRPKNGFIRFSIEHRKIICRDSPKMDNRQVSKILGAMWRKMSEVQRRPYEKKFEDEISGIREQVPDWKYAPVRPLKTDPFEPMPSRLRPRESLRRKVPRITRAYRKRQREQCSFTGNTTLQNTCRDEDSHNYMDKPTVNWVQCDVCFKWRRLPTFFNPRRLPEVWICSMNHDPRYQSCMIDEEEMIKRERKLQSLMDFS